MNKLVYRNTQSLLLLVSIIVLTAAIYFGYAKGLEACPLCLMQRFCTFIFGFFCLLGLCLSTLRRARGVAVAQMLFMAAGIYFSSRQLWLQSLPVDSSAVCMPGFDALIRYFSNAQIVKALLWGTGDCAEVTWRWLGLSMPAWSALYFLVMFLVSAVVFFGLSQRLASVNRP